MPRDTTIAVGYLAFLVFAWGGNYTWVKLAMADIGPLWFNVLRYGLAVLILLAVAMLRPGVTLVPVAGERLALAAIGLLQAGAMTTLTALAMRSIEASRVVLIAYTVPIWAMLWAIPLLGARPGYLSLIGAALGIGGLAILTDPGGMSWGPETLPGSLIALSGVLCWALGAVLYKRRGWQSPFWAQVFWQLAATALAMLALAPLLESAAEARWTATMLTVAVYNAIVPLLLGFFCWMQALSRISAHAAGQIMVLAPVYGVFQSHVVLGEPLSPGVLSALCLVVIGAILTLRGQRNETRSNR